MIKFFREDNGARVAAFVCDVCQKPIRDANLAMFLIRTDPEESVQDARPGAGAESIIVHKNTCDVGLGDDGRENFDGWEEMTYALAEATYIGGMDTPDGWFNEDVSPRPTWLRPEDEAEEEHED